VCLVDALLLRGLVSAAEKEDQGVSVLEVVDPVSGASSSVRSGLSVSAGGISCPNTASTALGADDARQDEVRCGDSGRGLEDPWVVDERPPGVQVLPDEDAFAAEAAFGEELVGAR